MPALLLYPAAASVEAIDEIFQFTPDLASHAGDKDFPKGTMFINATALRRACEDINAPIVLTEITEATYEQVRARNGVEGKKLEWLRAHPRHAAEPLLFLSWPEANGTHSQVLADGNHRLVVGYEDGQREFPAYVVPSWAWHTFLVATGVGPEDALVDALGQALAMAAGISVKAKTA